MQNQLYNASQLDNASDCINSCIRMRVQGVVEDVLRHNLSSYLRLMFNDNPKWVELHISGSEALVEFSRNKTQHRGFVDSLVGATAIEYESNLKNPTKYKSGYNQVKEYCAGLLNLNYPPENIRGILSDTVQWFAYDVKIITPDKLTGFSANDLELIEIESLNCEIDISPNFLILDFLNKHLGRIGSRIPTAESINSDLGFHSQLAQEYLPKLKTALHEIFISKPEYAELIQTVWLKFVNSVRDEDSVDTFDINFYIDEFYLTTMSKFICANVLEELAIISDEEGLKSIIDGTFFKLKGFENVVEYDFFGWLNNLPVHQTILELSSKIQLDLRVYDYSISIEEDLFSNLFNELAEKSRKLFLGQAMTPSWLANLVAQNVINKIDEDPRLIDMCCGSGTFVVAALKIISDRFSDLDATERSTKILNCVTGFDIDPLAVILAKINWLMIAKPYLNMNELQSVHIPIYNADSLFAVTPVSSDSDGADYYLLKMLDEEVSLPKHLLSSENTILFERILEVGYSSIMSLTCLPAAPFFKNSLDVIISQTAIQLSAEEYDSVLEFIKQYFTAIFRLNSQGKNGIWNFLILNSYRPALVEKSFNGLLSNPPWLTLSRIAENPYKNFLSYLAEELNIKPSGSSFLHIELATIFLLASIERYLMSNGVVGCVIPGTVLSGDHHHPFRSGQYHEANIDFVINEVWDLEKSIFNNRGIVIFGHKSAGSVNYPIQYQRIDQNETLEEGELYYSQLDSKSAWSTFFINRSNENSYNTLFTQGADIMPRSVYFHEIVDASNPTMATLGPIDPISSDKGYLLKDSKKFSDFRIESSSIEKSMIYPVLISNSLLPFHITTPPLAVLPIIKIANEWHPLAISALVTMSSGFKRFVSRASLLYGAGSNLTTLWEWLNTRSKLSNQNIDSAQFIVCCGTGGEHVCAHYLKSVDYDFTRIIIDQTINYYPTNSEREAIYLVGLLNNPLISEAIRIFQSDGNFGGRHIHSLPYRVVERFNEMDSLHLEVVAKTEALMNELEAIYAATSNPLLLRLRKPNESSIAFKRRKTRELILSLTTYEDYNTSCANVINR
jgi:hypothetical protein